MILSANDAIKYPPDATTFPHDTTIGFFFFIFAMIKAITPRYRYDQLMRLGWKVFLPFSLVWVVFVAFAAKFEFFGSFYARYLVGG